MRQLRIYLSAAILVLLIPSLVLAASLKVTWVDKSDNEANFQVERSLTGNTVDFAKIADTLPNVISYSDVGLAEGQVYFYRVNACNAGGCSTYTAIASGKTNTAIPAAPTGLTVTPQ